MGSQQRAASPPLPSQCLSGHMYGVWTADGAEVKRAGYRAKVTLPSTAG